MMPHYSVRHDVFSNALGRVTDEQRYIPENDLPHCFASAYPRNNVSVQQTKSTYQLGIPLFLFT